VKLKNSLSVEELLREISSLEQELQELEKLIIDD
jgi:hypothetical protein